MTWQQIAIAYKAMVFVYTTSMKVTSQKTELSNLVPRSWIPQLLDGISYVIVYKEVNNERVQKVIFSLHSSNVNNSINIVWTNQIFCAHSLI